MAQKIVGFAALESFWGRLNKWLQINFESLFKNDKDLEKRISQLEQLNKELIERLENLESTDFTTEDVEDNSDYFDIYNK